MEYPQSPASRSWLDQELYRQVTPEGRRGPSREEQILSDRAARLAEHLEEEDAGEQMSLLLIRLGEELFGLDAQSVDRVQPVEQLTRVPRVPDWVRGVTNLRGRLLSVVDLVRFFGLPARLHSGGEGEQEPDKQYLVVVKTPEMELALLASDVLAVEDIPLSRFREAGAMVRGLRAEYVLGIAERSPDRVRTNGSRDDLIVALDLRALLQDARLIVHEEVV
jgi:purine-binding chemotaxis protein CheW